jgi:hypothetical protein
VPIVAAAALIVAVVAGALLWRARPSGIPLQPEPEQNVVRVTIGTQRADPV